MFTTLLFPSRKANSHRTLSGMLQNKTFFKISIQSVIQKYLHNILTGKNKKNTERKKESLYANH